jgi:hypothetical protein
MDKLGYNLLTSGWMPLCIQTKNRIFYLNYLNLKMQQVKVRIDHTYQLHHKLVASILEIIPVRCKIILYFDLLCIF